MRTFKIEVNCAMGNNQIGGIYLYPKEDKIPFMSN